MKRDILLLHGALGNETTMFPLGKELEKEFEVHYLQFPGHGQDGVPNDLFSIGNFAQSILDFIRQKNLMNPVVLGYSMGGYAALLAASMQPDAFDRVVTLATKLRWTDEFADKECRKLDFGFLQEKAPAFIELLGKRFGEKRVEEVLAQTSELLQFLGRNQLQNRELFQKIECRVYLCVGSLDKMVTHEETEEVATLLKNGKLISIPETPHQIEAMNLQLVVQSIVKSIS